MATRLVGGEARRTASCRSVSIQETTIREEERRSSRTHELWPHPKTHEYWPNGQNSCGSPQGGGRDRDLRSDAGDGAMNEPDPLLGCSRAPLNWGVGPAPDRQHSAAELRERLPFEPQRDLGPLAPENARWPIRESPNTTQQISGVRGGSHACCHLDCSSWRTASARTWSYPIRYAIRARIASDHPGRPAENHIRFGRRRGGRIRRHGGRVVLGPGASADRAGHREADVEQRADRRQPDRD